MRNFLITFAKVISWIVFSALLLLVVVFVGVFNFGLLEYGINRELNALVGDNTPLEVNIGSIEGDFFNTLLISDVSVRYSADSISYPIAEIPTIRASYSLVDIWRGRFDFNILGIDSAQFTVRQDSAGVWLLPRIQSKDGSASAPIPSFSTKSLTISDASLRVFGRDSSWTVDSLNLSAGVISSDGAYALDLRKLNFVTDFHKSRMRSASGKYTYSSGRLMFKDMALDAIGLSLACDGWVALTDSLQDSLQNSLKHESVDGHIEIDSLFVDLKYLGGFAGKKYVGELDIDGEFDIKASELEGKVNIRGSFQERLFERLFARIKYSDGALEADTLYGRVLDGCAVAGKLSMDFSHPDIGYNFVGAIDSLNVKNIAKKAMATVISGEIELDGSGLTGSSMKIHADANLDESYFDIFHIHSADGGLYIYTDSLRLEPGFGVEYYENSFSASGLVQFSGPISVSGAAQLHNLSRFDNQTFIAELGGRGQANYALGGTFDDPNISGKFFSDSAWFYGMFAERAWYDFDVRSFLYKRTGTISARLGGLEAWEFPLDSISSDLRIDSNIVYFDKLEAFTGEAKLFATGDIDYLAEPQPITLNSATLAFRENTFHELDTVRLLFDSSGIDFVQAEFISVDSSSAIAESFSFSGRAGFDQNLSFGVDLENIDLNPWTRMIPDAPHISGRVSLAGEVSAGFDVLEFEASGRIDSLVYQDLYVGDIASDFRFADRLLTIDTLSLKTAGGQQSLSGTIPLDLRLGALPDTIPLGEQRLVAHVSETQFDFVSYFLPQIEELTGVMEIDAIISGTPMHPAFDGAGSLSDGALKIYELEIPAESLNVNFTMENRLVTITSGACRFPPEVRGPKDKSKKYNADKYGYASINSGSLEILSIDSIDYNVSLSAKDFPFKYTLGSIKGKANADLIVTGVTPPIVTGEIDLISALYEDEFLEEDAGYLLLTQFERLDSWDMDVNVSVVSQAVVRNSELDAEFKGTARAIRNNGLWSYLYNLEVIRGRVFLTTSSFRLDPGGTVINDDASINDPQLNLLARTKVRVPNPSAPGEVSTGTRQVEAAILVSGTLEEPIITYYDDPNVSDNDKIDEDQLYTMLAFGYQVGSADQDQLGMAGNRGGEMLASYLSSNLTRAGARTIGVETFEIDPNADFEQTEVTLGKYVLPGLYTYGKTDMTASGQEFGFEYYLGKHLLIQGRRDENDHYFLFLNLGWDY